MSKAEIEITNRVEMRPVTVEEKTVVLKLSWLQAEILYGYLGASTGGFFDDVWNDMRENVFDDKFTSEIPVASLVYRTDYPASQLTKLAYEIRQLDEKR